MGDFFHRGGYRWAILWVEDIGQAIAARAFRIRDPFEDIDARPLADGLLDISSYARGFRLELAQHDQIQTLRRWRAAGYSVRFCLVARGLGQSFMIEDEIPLLGHNYGGSRGKSTGDAVLIETHKYFANATFDHNLLALEEWLTAGATRVLPLAGETVYAYDPIYFKRTDIDAYDVNGDSVGSTNGADETVTSYVLPTDTWSVKVSSPDGGQRPGVLALKAPPVGGYQAGWEHTSSSTSGSGGDNDTHVLDGWGGATAEASTPTIDVDGTDYTPTLYELTPHDLVPLVTEPVPEDHDDYGFALFFYPSDSR